MRFIFLLIFICIGCIGELSSKSSYADSEIDTILVSRYNASVDYLNSFKVDSAGLILDTILLHIKDTKIYDTAFGLRVQLRKAQVLERDNKGDQALPSLLDIKQKALNSKVWDVYALASINLGLIYEKIGKGSDCIQNLRDAQKVLSEYSELEYIYPFFCVRISSFHRIYASKDSAIYYAQECLRTFEEYNEYAQGGDGYMLMTMLTDKNDLDQRLIYSRAAVEIFKKLEHHDALGIMLGSIADIYYKKGQYDKALEYNDTTILEAEKSIKGGFDFYRLLYSAYKFRGQIFSKLEQHDSSSYYIKRGYELHNQQIQKENYNKVLAIDAKYKDDKKALKIKEQQEQIRSEQIQSRLLMVIFGLVMLFTAGLTYYYNKLRKANRQTKLQAEQISKTNKKLSVSLKKQILLQGEVHHRVKNNLQVIISLLDLQKEESEDKETRINIDSMSKRIYSMAAIHNLLYQKEDMEFISLHEYVENLCYHHSNFSREQEKPVFTLDIEKTNLNLETSMPIGIIITELLTNSLKHARIEGQILTISIKIVNNNDGLIIYYKDNGPGFAEGNQKSKPKDLGFYILESMTRQLQGRLIIKNDNGASYEIYLKEKNKWIEENIIS